MMADEDRDVAAREAMSDALDLVVDHATSARELCEVGKAYQKAKIKLYLLQASAALISALGILQSKESAD
jgi:hypothetical protein